MAGRPQRRARLLAKTIARTGGGIPDTQGVHAAQLALQAAAVHALLTHHGNVRSALHAVAPNTASLPAAEQRTIARRIFDGNEFMEILCAEIARERKRLISRAVSIALDRQHPDAAIRAIDTLARVGGWYAPTKRVAAPVAIVPAATRSIADELALMEHEPGPAIAIQCDVHPDSDFEHGTSEAISDEGDGFDDLGAKRERTVRMRELGRKGGLALKATKLPDYHQQLGRLGGIATAREHSAEAAVERKRIVAVKLGNGDA
jgi:hypothetical protein